MVRMISAQGRQSASNLEKVQKSGYIDFGDKICWWPIYDVDDQ